jgi:hypothetical protein
MKGLGFYIWQIEKLPPVELVVATLRQVGAKWVSIKVQDGIFKFNNRDNNDKTLIAFMDVLRSAGIEVGGWGWIFPHPVLSPGAQAGLASERIQKLGLAHYLIDAEHYVKGKVNCPWETSPDRKASASTFMNQLDVNRKFPVGLSSYRFLSAHPGFPAKQFVNHDASKFVAPQMYWLGSHNPRQQLQRCIDEYNGIHPINPDFPMIPMGSAFAQKVKVGENQFVDWEPTTADIREFVQAAKDCACPAWGFWSLDWILQHQRLDWLEAMAEQGSSGAGEQGNGDAGEQAGSGAGELKFRVLGKILNIRSGPGIGYDDLGDLHYNDIVIPIDVAGPEAWIEIAPGKWCCVRSGRHQYLELVQN